MRWPVASKYRGYSCRLKNNITVIPQNVTVEGKSADTYLLYLGEHLYRVQFLRMPLKCRYSRLCRLLLKLIRNYKYILYILHARMYDIFIIKS